MNVVVGKYFTLQLLVTLTLFPAASEAFQRLNHHPVALHRDALSCQQANVAPNCRSTKCNKAFFSKSDDKKEYVLNQVGAKDNAGPNQKSTSGVIKKYQYIKKSVKRVVEWPKRGWNTIFHRLSNARKIEPITSSTGNSLPILACASTIVALPSATMTSRKLMYGTLAFILSCMMLLLHRQQRERILYPGSNNIDQSYISDASIPTDGTFDGCPFIGPLSMYSDFNKWFSIRSAKLGNSNFFKLYSFAKPSVMISGSKLIKELMDKEFDRRPSNNNIGKVSQATDFGEGSSLLFGTNGMTGVTDDRKEYHSLRKLVGESMTPKSLRLAVPALQEAVEMTLDEILEEASLNKDGIVRMKDYMHQFTQDVAWKQIIGLNLRTKDEIREFRTAMNVWLDGFTNWLLFLLPKFVLEKTKAVKAKRYLDRVVAEKIDELQRNGKPDDHAADGTALSAMVFATLGEEGSEGVNRLTREQIIDNTAVLLLAGSETTANTLTNAIYMLGTNKQVWDKIIQEQEKVMSESGTDKITKDLLDNECPYLNAVVNEALRLRPVSGGGARVVDETTIIDGKQIPKDWLAWYGVALTHEQDPITYETDGSHMDVIKGFKPERWLDEKTKPTTEFIPFGVGNRFCLGYALALLEMKLFLALMARKKIDFELVHESLHPNKERKWKEGIILTPADGSKVYIKQKE